MPHGPVRDLEAVLPRLWSLPYSPWSEQAKWALDASLVGYTKQRYDPMLSEPAMRWRLRKWRGPISVPVLECDGGRLSDSLDIALWAARQGPAESSLIPAEALAEILEYNTLSGRGLAAGRERSLIRLLEDPEGLRDMVPRGVSRVLGPLSVTVAAFGVRRTLRKYDATVGQDAAATLTEVLDRLREALRAPGGTTRGVAHLLSRFSYADIVMAQVLAFVEPPKSHLRLTDATRRSFTDPELRARYGDLLAWRDQLYAQLRPAAVAVG